MNGQWATVVLLDPLRIRLDGPDSNPLPFTPDTLVPAESLTVGERVWVLSIGGASGATSLLILGAYRGPKSTA